MGRSLEFLLAAVLIVLGALFLALNLTGITVTIESWWPLLIVVPGLAFFVPVFLPTGRQAHKALSALAIPGCVTTTVGLTALYSSLTDRWEAWTYLWTLPVGAIGLGLITASLLGDWSPGVTRAGRRLLGLSLLAFVILCVIFEVLIFGGMARLYWPVILVLIGMLQLVWVLRPRRRSLPAHRGKGRV